MSQLPQSQPPQVHVAQIPVLVQPGSQITLIIPSKCPIPNRVNGHLTDNNNNASHSLELVNITAQSPPIQGYWHIMVQVPNFKINLSPSQICFELICGDHQTISSCSYPVRDNIEPTSLQNRLRSSSLGSTLEAHDFDTYLGNLLNDGVDMNAHDLFSKSHYPLVTSFDVTSLCIKTQMVIQPLDDGTQRHSILNSYSRIARILMSLDLGRALMIVKVEGRGEANQGTIDPNEEKLRYICSSGIDILLNGHTRKYKFFTTSNSGIKSNSALFIDSAVNTEILRNMLEPLIKPSLVDQRKCLPGLE